LPTAGYSDLHAVLSHIEQAKAMHKEEIENAFDIGVNSYYDLNSPSNWEQYYNETYGGNK
jgi:predicted metal-dependent peptidase